MTKRFRINYHDMVSSFVDYISCFLFREKEANSKTKTHTHTQLMCISDSKFMGVFCVRVIQFFVQYFNCISFSCVVFLFKWFHNVFSISRTIVWLLFGLTSPSPMLFDFSLVFYFVFARSFVRLKMLNNCVGVAATDVLGWDWKSDVEKKTLHIFLLASSSLSSNK